jgi:hypothetical protein
MIAMLVITNVTRGKEVPVEEVVIETSVNEVKMLTVV